MVAVLESRNEKQYIGYSHSSGEVLQLIILLNLCKRLTGKINSLRLHTTIYGAFNVCPIIIKRGEEVVNNDALIKLLMQPNEQQSFSEFLEQALIYYWVGGEAPIWGDAVIPSRLPKRDIYFTS